MCARGLEVCRNFVHIICSLHLGQIAIVTWRYIIIYTRGTCSGVNACDALYYIVLNQRRGVREYHHTIIILLLLYILCIYDFDVILITIPDDPLQKTASHVITNCSRYTGATPAVLQHWRFFKSHIRSSSAYDYFTTDPDDNIIMPRVRISTTGIPSISLDRERRRDTADG